MSVTGSSNKFGTVDCAYDTEQASTIPVAAPPVLIPDLRTNLEVQPAETAPGGTLAYTGSLTNTGALLGVPVLFGATSVTDAAVTVTGTTAHLEYFDETTQAWVRLASSGGRLTFDTRPIATAGAHYGSTVDGTTVDPRSTAAWSGVAQVMLTPAELRTLTDTTVVSALRVKVETTTSGGRARTFARSADNLVDTLRDQGGRVTDARIAFTPAVGDSRVLDSRDLPALTTVAPGGPCPSTVRRTCRRSRPAAMTRPLRRTSPGSPSSTTGSSPAPCSAQPTRRSAPCSRPRRPPGRDSGSAGSTWTWCSPRRRPRASRPTGT